MIIALLLSGCATTSVSTDVVEMPLQDVVTLAQKGDAEAIHALCYRYSYGYYGALKNYKKAYLWCDKSAKTNNSSSITLLAELYYIGNYVEQNYHDAFTLYERAAFLGHSHAQKILYVMYKEGQGVAPNKGLAEYWIKRSAANGNAQAKRIVKQLSI